MTVKNLKNIIYKKTDIPNETYYLTYISKILELNKYLEYYSINKNATIHLHVKFMHKYSPKFNIMTLVDKDKRVKAEKAAIISQYPCIVEMKYYIITPKGNHYYGNTQYIKNKLNTESFKLKDLRAIEDNIYAN